MPNGTWDLILDRAIEWRKVADKQDDPFLKFAIEYIAFNALCRAKYGYKKKDRDIIESLKKELPPSRIPKDKISKLKEIAPIVNVRNAYLDKDRHILHPEDLDDPSNVIEAVYWARNNLFHGDKQYSFEKDQKLVEIGYEILLDINDWLIEEITKEESES
ncbi:hypothetical protein TBCH5v1_2152 [Thermococcus barophilus]|uniref:HEPN domain-containing protein n=2 Tax=Thermococcus barophilus TaxID=55802 RepID=A0A0S1XE60_THEBA|nr:hypothetical protein TBCH5v1_2152 [Thermococcus barophilus]